MRRTTFSSYIETALGGLATLLGVAGTFWPAMTPLIAALLVAVGLFALGHGIWGLTGGWLKMHAPLAGPSWLRNWLIAARYGPSVEHYETVSGYKIENGVCSLWHLAFKLRVISRLPTGETIPASGNSFLEIQQDGFMYPIGGGNMTPVRIGPGKTNEGQSLIFEITDPKSKPSHEIPNIQRSFDWRVVNFGMNLYFQGGEAVHVPTPLSGTFVGDDR